MSDNSLKSYSENVVGNKNNESLIKTLLNLLREGPKACFELENEIDSNRPYDLLCSAKRQGLIVNVGKKRNNQGRLVSIYGISSALPEKEVNAIRLSEINKKEDELLNLIKDLNEELDIAKSLIESNKPPFHKHYSDIYGAYPMIEKLLKDKPLIGYKEITYLIGQIFKVDFPDKNVGARIEEMKQMGHVVSPCNDSDDRYELLDISSRYDSTFLNEKYVKNIKGRIERYSKVLERTRARKQVILENA